MTDHRRGRWAVPCLVFGLAYAHAGRADAAVRMPTHVACVGDSITAGAGSSDAATKSYPAQLQTLFGSQVLVKNFGHSGATMLTNGDLPYETQTEYQGAINFVNGAGENALVDVVIMLGTNDSKPQNWTPIGKPKNDQQYLADYRAMVEHFLALTPKPEVFLALPLSTGTSPCCAISGTVIHDEILPLIKQLAKEKALPVIDLNTPTAGHNDYFVDGVHPNDAAYVTVAKLFRDGLLEDLASAGAGGTGGAAGSSGVAGGTSSSSGGTAGALGTNGGAGTAGSNAAAGSAGSGAGSGSESAAGSGGTGARASGGGGQAGSGGGAPLARGNSSDSSGCSVSGSGKQGGFAALLSLSILLSLVGLRRRPVLHARHDHDHRRSP